MAKKYNELKDTIILLREKNESLTIDMEHLSQENEIMRKYYKVDEIPSPDVQAKILADLRLHDMEFKILQEKLNDCKKQLSFNQILFPRLYI